MKKALAAILFLIALVVAIPLEIDRMRDNPPDTRASVASYLDVPVLDYQIINDQPLVLLDLDGRYYLDTLTLQPVSKQWPPRPMWRWSGDWERIPPADGGATVMLSAAFDAPVLVGLVDDPNVASIEIVRGSETILHIQVAGDGFIVPVGEAKLADRVRLLDADGAEIGSMQLREVLGD